MTRVFLNDDQKLDPEDLHHLFHVLRMRAGDSLEAVYKRDLYRARLTDQSAQDGNLVLEEKLEAREKGYRVFLLQGLAKGQKWEEVLEHGTEVGIDTFVAIQMKRSLRKVNHKWDKLKNRWEKIVEKAAKQSKQIDIPQVYPPMTLKEGLEILPKDSLILVCYEEEKDHFMKDYIQGQEKTLP
ncbi:RNA methyltransferase, RsmE family [Peptoniphilus sp. oral taxon 375 str. F0436]|nr:RNA methyltransferase, RsmE family [Peptoniphilus sp. oral taxon 375 str. F0436]